MLFLSVFPQSGYLLLLEEEFLTFSGAWFEVQYPASFVAKPSLPSASGQGYDSAFFESPDGEVSFYVFSPQWSGEATDIVFTPKTENLITDDRKSYDQKEIRWVSYAAKDGSYTRSYQEVTEQGGSIHWVIGLSYKSQESYERYKSSYLTFKQSLQQFAD